MAIQVLKNAGIYVGARPTPDTRALLTRFYCRPELAKYGPLKPQELHATIMYSPAPMSDRVAALTNDRVRTFEAKILRTTYLGKYTVLMLESEELKERHNEWILAGGRPTFPEYLPHLSFAKRPPNHEIVRQLADLEGKTLIFSDEYYRAPD